MLLSYPKPLLDVIYIWYDNRCYHTKYKSHSTKALDMTKEVLVLKTYCTACQSQCILDFAKTAGYVINRCLQTHMSFRG